MEYIFRKEIQVSNVYRDGKGQEWRTITPGQYKSRSREEKRICADMRKTDSGSMERLLTDGEKRFGLYDYRGKVKWHEKVTGYVPVQTKTGNMTGYVRIVEPSVFKRVLALLIVLLTAAGIGTGIYWYLQRETGPDVDQTAVAYKVEGMVNSEKDKTMLPYISSIEMFDSRHVKKALANPEGNGVYFTYTITLDDTGETLYESGMIEPGKAVLEFDLSRDMEPGTYDITVQIRANSIANPEEALNGGESKAKLTVYGD